MGKRGYKVCDAGMDLWKKKRISAIGETGMGLLETEDASWVILGWIYWKKRMQ